VDIAPLRDAACWRMRVRSGNGDLRRACCRILKECFTRGGDQRRVRSRYREGLRANPDTTRALLDACRT
jgi:hypothetical protein